MNIAYGHWVGPRVHFPVGIHIMLPDCNVTAVDGIAKDLIQMLLGPSAIQIRQSPFSIELLNYHWNSLPFRIASEDPSYGRRILRIGLKPVPGS